MGKVDKQLATYHQQLTTWKQEGYEIGDLETRLNRLEAHLKNRHRRNRIIASILLICFTVVLSFYGYITYRNNQNHIKQGGQYLQEQKYDEAIQELGLCGKFGIDINQKIKFMKEAYYKKTFKTANDYYQKQDWFNAYKTYAESLLYADDLSEINVKLGEIESRISEIIEVYRAEHNYEFALQLLQILKNNTKNPQKIEVLMNQIQTEFADHKDEQIYQLALMRVEQTDNYDEKIATLERLINQNSQNKYLQRVKAKINELKNEAYSKWLSEASEKSNRNDYVGVLTSLNNALHYKPNDPTALELKSKLPPPCKWDAFC